MIEEPVEHHPCSECDGIVIYLSHTSTGECQRCGLGF
jgi:uncharacterized paraquat-inducible protein A